MVMVGKSVAELQLVLLANLEALNDAYFFK